MLEPISNRNQAKNNSKSELSTVNCQLSTNFTFIQRCTEYIMVKATDQFCDNKALFCTLKIEILCNENSDNRQVCYSK